MKLIRSIALMALVASATAHASSTVATDPGIASGVVSAPASAKVKCSREKEIGSNRVKRVCLPEDQLKRLTPEQRSDLIRSEKSAAELLAD